jgi:hypothetical protein
VDLTGGEGRKLLKREVFDAFLAAIEFGSDEKVDVEDGPREKQAGKINGEKATRKTMQVKEAWKRLLQVFAAINEFLTLRRVDRQEFAVHEMDPNKEGVPDSWKHEVKAFQKLCDEFGDLWASLVGVDMETNYVHMLVSGHVALHALRVGPLGDWANQASEAANGWFKWLLLSQTNHGGNSTMVMAAMLGFALRNLFWKTRMFFDKAFQDTLPREDGRRLVMDLLDLLWHEKGMTLTADEKERVYSKLLNDDAAVDEALAAMMDIDREGGEQHDVIGGEEQDELQQRMEAERAAYMGRDDEEDGLGIVAT